MQGQGYILRQKKTDRLLKDSHQVARNIEREKRNKPQLCNHIYKAQLPFQRKQVS